MFPQPKLTTRYRSTSWQEEEREKKLLASRQVPPGPGLYSQCVDWYRPMPALYRWRTQLTLRPSIPLLSPGETGSLWSGLPPMYNNNIRPWRTKFTDRTKLLNIHIFLPQHEDFDGFAGIKLSFRWNVLFCFCCFEINFNVCSERQIKTVKPLWQSVLTLYLYILSLSIQPRLAGGYCTYTCCTPENHQRKWFSGKAVRKIVTIWVAKTVNKQTERPAENKDFLQNTSIKHTLYWVEFWLVQSVGWCEL